MLRFDRFTEGAQDVAARGYEILQRYGHNQVDTEHILLALLEQPEGAIPQILAKNSVDPELMKKRLDGVLRGLPSSQAPQPPATGQVFITPRVKRILELADEDANRLKEHISTEHIFLGILSERNTAAASLLSEAGITKERLYPEA